jgi:hypothetical protein
MPSPPHIIISAVMPVRRHKVGFGAAAAILGTVIVGSVLTTAQAMRALRAERTEYELRESARQAEIRTAVAHQTAKEQEDRLARIGWARNTALPQIDRLIQAQDIASAFKLALEVEKYLADDPALTRLWPQVSLITSVETKPDGAEIYAKPYHKPDAEWQFLGVSPLKNVRLAREPQRWQFKKAG